MHASFFKSLSYADIWTNDLIGALDIFHDAFGFPETTRDKVATYASFGTDNLVFEFGRDPVTRIEINGPASSGQIDRKRIDYPYILERVYEPPLRPAILHATVVATPNLPILVERLQRLGLRHRFDKGGENTMDRLWVGFSADKRDPFYSPEADAGLMFEFWESSSDAVVSKLVPVRGAPNDLARIEASTMLVADLQHPLTLLKANFDWEPSRVWRDGATQIAEFKFDDPRSASLHFIAPSDADSRPGKHLTQWGAGAYVRRIACSDLSGREQSLSRRGIDVETGPALDGSGRKAALAFGGRHFYGMIEYVEA